MITSRDKISETFLKLLETMKTLRGPNGCPWDKEQTAQDLNPHLLEETYEVLEAVDSKNPESLKEELGDLLLQIVFHCQIAQETDQFYINDVMEVLIDKLVRRHPHVFADVKVEGVSEVLTNWEKIKAEENKTKKGKDSILSGVPNSLPALLKAYRLGQKASRVGFDWTNLEGVLEKVEEEIRELRIEMKENNPQKIAEEFGDLLFSLAQFGRFLDVNPEEALRHACEKFTKRFQWVEQSIRESKKDWEKTSPQELENLWEQAKK